MARGLSQSAGAAPIACLTPHGAHVTPNPKDPRMQDIGTVVYWAFVVVFWAALVWLAIWLMLFYARKRRRRREEAGAAGSPDDPRGGSE